MTLLNFGIAVNAVCKIFDLKHILHSTKPINYCQKENLKLRKYKRFRFQTIIKFSQINIYRIAFTFRYCVETIASMKQI